MVWQGGAASKYDVSQLKSEAEKSSDTHEYL